jgi:hypothetical protein
MASMSHARRLILIAFIAGCLCAIPMQYGWSAGPSTQPATKPADPDVEEGRAKARQDLEAGKLGEALAIPETFLMSFWSPHSKDRNLLEYYQAVVADRYGVKSETVMFHSASPGRRAWACGYNDVMNPEIEKRFGKDVMNKAWVEACHMAADKRDEYLTARKEKAAAKSGATTKAASQPSTQSTVDPRLLNK